jgi:uncharacterized protein (DUF2235 family)
MSNDVQSSRRRLILCFDGTWNTPESDTNVWRLYSAVPDVHAGYDRQVKFYDKGVGTDKGMRVLGGALGLGLDANVLDGYCWLAQQYSPGGGTTVEFAGESGIADGDEIYLFGFSRGAFTARSLCGLIGRCGILRRDQFAAGGGDADLRSIRREHSVVQQAWELYRIPSAQLVRDSAAQARVEAFRREHSYRVKIRFVGVWDTVGALGIPTSLPLSLARGRYQFHDTELGRLVEHAYHAMAIDEHRKSFQATLWTRWEAHQSVEQRWFPGAHCNVGGGYQDDLLPGPPLKWIADKAVAAGLVFSRDPAGDATPDKVPRDFELLGNEYLSPVRDSYREFMGGLYAAIQRPSFRRMLVDGIREIVDPIAHRKWALDPGYRPQNLAMAGRAGLNDPPPGGTRGPAA